MMTLHPEILSKNGKKQFAILPYEEFVVLQERLADAEDLLELRKAKAAWLGAARKLRKPIPTPRYRPAIYRIAS